VAYHFAHSGNKNWPEFRELLGAKGAGHPWDCEVGIKIDEPDHPLNAAFGGKDFRLSEEIFQFVDPYSRDKLRVLISIDTAQTNMAVKGLVRTDGDYALAWVKAYGKGRVFYTSLGHRTRLYWNPMILRFYLDGIQFVMGDLEAPMEPLTGRPGLRLRRPRRLPPRPRPPPARSSRSTRRRYRGAPCTSGDSRAEPHPPDLAARCEDALQTAPGVNSAPSASLGAVASHCPSAMAARQARLCTP